MILYADRVTDSMQRAIEETNRRRDMQTAYNTEHNITPQSVRSAIDSGIDDELAAQKLVLDAAGIQGEDYVTEEDTLEELHAEMLAAAANLEYERAARARSHRQAQGGASGKRTEGREGRSGNRCGPSLACPACHGRVHGAWC